MYSKQGIALVLILVTTMMTAAPAFPVNTGEYASGAGAKLGRGVLNTVTGWGEGFFKGIGLGVARTLAGAFEIATFWAPVPDEFEPVMEPATVFDPTSNKTVAKTGDQRPSE